jgi:hypothetical protein
MFPYLNPRQSPFWIFLGTAIRRRARLIGLFDGRNNNPENPEIGSKCQKYFSFFFYNIFEDSSFEKWVSRWTKNFETWTFFFESIFFCSRLAVVPLKRWKLWAGECLELPRKWIRSFSSLLFGWSAFHGKSVSFRDFPRFALTPIFIPNRKFLFKWFGDFNLRDSVVRGGPNTLTSDAKLKLSENETDERMFSIQGVTGKNLSIYDQVEV